MDGAFAQVLGATGGIILGTIGLGCALLIVRFYRYRVPKAFQYYDGHDGKM